VANAHGCNARGHGFAPQPRRYLWDFVLESIQSPAQRDFKMVCVTIITLLTRWTAIINTRKQLHAHTLAHTIVGGWYLAGRPPKNNIRASVSPILTLWRDINAIT